MDPSDRLDDRGFTGSVLAREENRDRDNGFCRFLTMCDVERGLSCYGRVGISRL